MRLLTAYRILSTLGMGLFWFFGAWSIGRWVTGYEIWRYEHAAMTFGAVLWAVFAVLAHRRAKKLGVSSE